MRGTESMGKSLKDPRESLITLFPAGGRKAEMEINT